MIQSGSAAPQRRRVTKVVPVTAPAVPIPETMNQAMMSYMETDDGELPEIVDLDFDDYQNETQYKLSNKKPRKC